MNSAHAIDISREEAALHFLAAIIELPLKDERVTPPISREMYSSLRGDISKFLRTVWYVQHLYELGSEFDGV